MRYTLLFLFLFCVKGYALGVSDFYDENGQLIEVLDPPFFEHFLKQDASFCKKHSFDGPLWYQKSSQHRRKVNDYVWVGSYFYEYVLQQATDTLINAKKAGEGAVSMPPPYYWKQHGYTYRQKEKADREWNSFFKRFSPVFIFQKTNSHQSWQYEILNSFEYRVKYDYLCYWFDFCYRLEKKRLLDQVAWNEKRGITDDYLKKCIDSIDERRAKTFWALEEGQNRVSNLLLEMYSECIEEHRHPASLYERGRIFFAQGDTVGFLTDINALINIGFTLSTEMQFDLGRAYNEANQYNLAIKVLSEAIRADPENKEAYFERALSYFETGQFDLALLDYISSELYPTLIDPNNERHFQYVKFSTGIALGCLKGSVDSTVDFVPSLLSTIYGIGKGLWVFSSNPVGVSKELIDSCRSCIEYLSDNLSKELIAELIPELRECLKKWDQLEEDKKGYYVGYVLGRYGVDMLAWGGSMRAVKFFRDVYKANAVLTLEKLSKSGANCEELLIASQKYFKKRELYKTKCFMSMKDQEKHIPGTNNFKTKKWQGEIHISTEELKLLTESKIGEGIPWRRSFGESAYIEVVEYEKSIGVHVVRETGEKIPTSFGAIHYNSQGGYHVVPISPTSSKSLRVMKDG